MTSEDERSPWRPQLQTTLGHCLGALALLPPLVGQASAHGVGPSSFEAPLPLPYLLVGAGATVALTAVGLGLLGSVPEGSRRLTRLDGRWPTRGATALRLGFLALVVAVIVQGLFGRQVAAENLATVAVWPLWIKGFALVAVVSGSPWRLLSPARTLYRVLSAVEGRPLGARALPAWVGSWPAVAGFACLVSVENLTAATREPATTAGLVAGYLALVLAGGVVFGPDWFRRADPFEVFYRLLGRVSVLSIEVAGAPAGRRPVPECAGGRGAGESGARADGGLAEDRSTSAALLPPVRRLDRVDIAVRPPWRGAARPVAGSGLATLVVTAVYAVSFDGFVETPTYQTLLFAVRNATGLGPMAGLVVFVAGLVSALAIFALIATFTGYLAGLSRPSLAIAPTLVPIAAAYEVAHTYTYVGANLGRLPALVGGAVIDPLWWLGIPGFWASQVVLLVAGHLVGVLAAHAVLSRRTDRSGTVLAHLPLVGLMVGYTMISLWIVSLPVVG